MPSAPLLAAAQPHPKPERQTPPSARRPEPPANAAAPWLGSYPVGRPAQLTPEFTHALDMLDAAVQARPDLPLIRYFDGHLTLSEVNAAADALAALLQSRGFAAGDRLALYTQNNPGFVIGLLAAWKAGGMAVPINPMNRPRELRYALDNSGACALLCLDALHGEVVQPTLAEGGLAVHTLVTTSALDWQQRNDLRVLPHTSRLPVPEGSFDLLAVVAQGGRPAPASHRHADEVALLTYTSGTTGQPKGAMNTHGNVAFTAQIYRDWTELKAGQTVLGIAPLFHITGLIGHIALAVLARCTLALSHRFHPEVMLDSIRETRPAFSIGAINAYIALMNQPGVRREDFASFHAIYSGGAPIAPATVEAFQQLTGHVIHSGFGMTETCSPTHMVPLGMRPPVDPISGALSVGIPVSSTEVRIVSDSGKPLPAGEVGEIVVAGPQVMRGYWHMPEATAIALAGGHMHTGDVGFMDENGWFYLVDRKKDMINAGGYKVWPREVEDVLYQHPAVREAAVVGVPDEYRGETVKAVVSLKPGQRASADELIAHCKAHLSAYKYPRLIEVLDELPKTVTGKILRRNLR